MVRKRDCNLNSILVKLLQFGKRSTVAMRCLVTALTILCLAGCSQEQWNYAETSEDEVTVVQVQPPIEPVPAPTEPVEQPVKPVELVEPNEPVEPTPVEPVEPKPPVEPVEPPVKPVPATKPEENPPDPNISPAEIIARKLVSDNPEENLEVLNDALAQWIAEKGELPEKIGDLVAGELLPMLPMAPQGKIFSIDRDAKMIVLVAKN